MAKVLINADTESGEITASINGKSVENLRDIQMSYYPSNDEKYPSMCAVSISTYTLDDDGVRHYGQICAAESPAGKTAAYMGASGSKYDGFVDNPAYVPEEKENKYSQAKASVEKMFQRKSN